MTENENVQDIIRLAVCSDIRKNILIFLNKGDKSLKSLRELLNVSSTTAIHALRELEKSKLTFQDKDKKYGLTNTGKILALKLVDFNDAAEVLKLHEGFWLEHDMSGIPEHLMEKIGWLRDSDVIQIDSLDIIKTHRTYVNLITNATWIRGVSPIYSPDYEMIFKKIVESNVNTQLILTEAVLNKLHNSIGYEKFKDLSCNYQLELFVVDDNLKVAFTVTDSFLSLGFFSNNDVYDPTHDLISTDHQSVRWGVELFEYYLEKANKYE